ncbi:ribosome-inactivating protein luffaculin 1-like [Cucurbita pepo subsp. pepo]|uniref:ribosome-inactivating protein luffaculin 1-like n=1 Tax=Cucurbita pepo subsp. pepo TaxID=3664 RepID=UPI000C9D7AF0|nr:ribosome-inactivating protein luffaculin 1-like [Cucurbita pepo subsp. pepo]
MASRTYEGNMKRLSMLSSLILTVFLTIFLGASSVQSDVSFSLSGGPTSYEKFIEDLRKTLPSNEMVYKIPLLRASASGVSRYTLMKLTNYDGKSITAAIDVTNVYIMGYLVNTTSYFFNETEAKLASQYVFKGSTIFTLPYSGNYERLQIAAGKKREAIPLGFRALDSAITTLFHYDSTAAAGALLVIIQTTAEASRYKYIEQQILERAYKNEAPSPAAISLENSWSALSKQIQLAQSNGGNFKNPVVITDNKGKPVQINNVSSKVVTNNIKLLLNKINIVAFDNVVSTTLRFGATRMP